MANEGREKKEKERKGKKRKEKKWNGMEWKDRKGKGEMKSWIDIPSCIFNGPGFSQQPPPSMVSNQKKSINQKKTHKKNLVFFYS